MTDAHELVGRLIQANYDSYAAVSQQLIDNLQKEVAELKAEREIVRDRLEEVCNRPWSPNPQAVLAALFVTRQEIAERVAAESEVSR